MKMRRIGALMLAVVLWMCSYTPVSAITPLYNNVTDATVTLTFEGIVAKCKVNVTAATLKTEIKGDLVLTDLTTGQKAASWSFSAKGELNESRSAVVLRGHNYELKFTGTAKKGTSTENISEQVDGICPQAATTSYRVVFTSN